MLTYNIVYPRKQPIDKMHLRLSDRTHTLCGVRITADLHASEMNLKSGAVRETSRMLVCKQCRNGFDEVESGKYTVA